MESEEQDKKEFTRAELIGQWNAIGAGEDSDSEVKTFKLLEGSIAEIQIVASLG